MNKASPSEEEGQSKLVPEALEASIQLRSVTREVIWDLRTKTGLCPAHQAGVFGPRTGQQGKQAVLLGGRSCQPKDMSANLTGRDRETWYALPIGTLQKLGSTSVCQALPRDRHEPTVAEALRLS